MSMSEKLTWPALEALLSLREVESLYEDIAELRHGPEEEVDLWKKYADPPRQLTQKEVWDKAVEEVLAVVGEHLAVLDEKSRGEY